jgi:hypothetical protein
VFPFRRIRRYPAVGFPLPPNSNVAETWIWLRFIGRASSGGGPARGLCWAPRGSVDLQGAINYAMLDLVEVYDAMIQFYLLTFQCMMMVLFQNRIIYMPGVPLGAKRERIQDYKHSFAGIDWKEHRRSIQTADGKLLSYVVGKSEQTEDDGGVVVVYFQGHLPPSRLTHNMTRTDIKKECFINATATPWTI